MAWSSLILQDLYASLQKPSSGQELGQRCRCPLACWCPPGEVILFSQISIVIWDIHIDMGRLWKLPSHLPTFLIAPPQWREFWCLVMGSWMKSLQISSMKRDILEVSPSSSALWLPSSPSPNSLSMRALSWPRSSHISVSTTQSRPHHPSQVSPHTPEGSWRLQSESLYQCFLSLSLSCSRRLTASWLSWEVVCALQFVLSCLYFSTSRSLVAKSAGRRGYLTGFWLAFVRSWLRLERSGRSYQKVWLVLNDDGMGWDAFDFWFLIIGRLLLLHFQRFGSSSIIWVSTASALAGLLIARYGIMIWILPGYQTLLLLLWFGTCT